MAREYVEKAYARLHPQSHSQAVLDAVRKSCELKRTHIDYLIVLSLTKLCVMLTTINSNSAHARFSRAANGTLSVLVRYSRAER
jgi:hypothetical protein